MKGVRIANAVNEFGARFEGDRFKSARILWCEKTEARTDQGLSFLLQGPYGIKNSKCFEGLEFNHNSGVNMVAERYGGEGLSANGGGGRCGNIGEYQLKGVGANCMVGDHDEKVHSYGGLDAPLAAIETIYTSLFNQIMPMGAVKVHGLVLVGENTAFYHHPANKCWGVVMVRDRCLRPAHLMRAPQFKPRAEYKHELCSDLARIRRINKRLAREYKDVNQFIMFLGEFLKNCANQFGFARAMRIMHGAMTPSNLAFNGQWLDLPMASVVRGGVNQCLTSQFFNEHECPVSCVVEILHNFGKYNGTVMNTDPLIKYYYEHFEAYFRYYVGYVIGFNLNIIDKLDGAQWETLSSAFNRVIHANPKLVNDPVIFSEEDPVRYLIKGLFLSLEDADIARKDLKKSGLGEGEIDDLVGAFSSCMQVAWAENKGDYLSREEFHVSQALSALKRAYLSCIFYNNSVSDKVWDLCQRGYPEDLGHLIEDYRSIVGWAFEDPSSCMTVLESDGLLVYREKGVYTYRYRDQNFQETRYFEEIITVFSSLSKEESYHKQGIFEAYLSVLGRILTVLSTEASGGDH